MGRVNISRKRAAGKRRKSGHIHDQDHSCSYCLGRTYEMTETDQYRREDGEHITILDYATVSDIATDLSSSSKSSRTAAHAGYRQKYGQQSSKPINIVIARTAEQGHGTTSTSPPGPYESQTRAGVVDQGFVWINAKGRVHAGAQGLRMPMSNAMVFLPLAGETTCPSVLLCRLPGLWREVWHVRIFGSAVACTGMTQEYMHRFFPLPSRCQITWRPVGL